MLQTGICLSICCVAVFGCVWRKNTYDELTVHLGLGFEIWVCDAGVLHCTGGWHS